MGKTKTLLINLSQLFNIKTRACAHTHTNTLEELWYVFLAACMFDARRNCLTRPDMSQVLSLPESERLWSSSESYIFTEPFRVSSIKASNSLQHNYQRRTLHSSAAGSSWLQFSQMTTNVAGGALICIVPRCNSIQPLIIPSCEHQGAHCAHARARWSCRQAEGLLPVFFFFLCQDFHFESKAERLHKSLLLL